MSEYGIRRMKPSELWGFYKHIEQDFSEDEHAPYAVLYEQLQNGIQEGWVFCDGDRDLAYSICAASNANEFVLVSLLAVYPEYRGRGIGSVFLKAMNEKFADKQAILVEVEKPELSKSAEDRSSRVKRIAFYEREGFYGIPGIDYAIWGVPMHIMAKPMIASKETVDDGIGQFIHAIYLQLMGERFIHKMHFVRLDGEI